MESVKSFITKLNSINERIRLDSPVYYEKQSSYMSGSVAAFRKLSAYNASKVIKPNRTFMTNKWSLQKKAQRKGRALYMTSQNFTILFYYRPFIFCADLQITIFL